MSEKYKVDISVFDRIDQISELDWDRCAQNEKSNFSKDPFTTYRFLKALEDSASVGGVSGWLPRYLVAKINNLVIGVAPMYGKSHSQGEYVFDHSWAHAYQRAGGRYYPKIQIAVPFYAVTGRRFLVCEGYEELGIKALMNAAKQMCLQNNISGVHITFCTQSEVEIGQKQGFLHRKGQQFHWLNKNYGNFDEFLSNLASRKRKAIRKERRIANTFGGEIVWLIGDQIKLGRLE